MPNDLESAFRCLLKLVVQEVTSEIQNRGQFIDHKKSEQDSDSDDRLLLRAREVAERLAISERHLRRIDRGRWAMVHFNSILSAIIDSTSSAVIRKEVQLPFVLFSSDCLT